MTKTDGLVWGTWSLMLFDIMCNFVGEPGWPFDSFLFSSLNLQWPHAIHCEMSLYIVAHLENSGVTTAEPQQNGPPSF